jgi:hypothetical protein
MVDISVFHKASGESGGGFQNPPKTCPDCGVPDQQIKNKCHHHHRLARFQLASSFEVYFSESKKGQSIINAQATFPLPIYVFM